MKKRLLAIVTLVFILASCDDSIKMADVHVYNYSTVRVTEITVMSSSVEKGFKDVLEPGENCTLITDWVDGNEVSLGIDFSMKGQEYGTREEGIAMADPTGRFKPYKRISNGDVLTVKIYDDYWEW